MENEKKYKKWIEEIFHKYKSILFIEKYHLKLEKNNENYLACKFNFPYLDAVILYSDESIKHWREDKKNAERRIIHEFCHIITDPFYATVMGFPSKKQIEDARERLTDHIAQIVNKHLTKLSK